VRGESAIGGGAVGGGMKSRRASGRNGHGAEGERGRKEGVKAWARWVEGGGGVRGGESPCRG